MFDYKPAAEPWRMSGSGMPKHCFVIGVAGGTASGKTTVCDAIMQRLHDQCAVLISQDAFYKGLTPEQIANVKGAPRRDPLSLHPGLSTSVQCFVSRVA